MSSQTDSWEVRIDGMIDAMSLPEKVSQLLHESPALEDHGVPEYNWWNECLHGVARAGKATVFPQAIGLAATFDTELLHRIAVAISDEGRAKYHASIKADNRTQYRGLTFWTPNINIFRDPRWGRGQETYGEDPYLTARMGTTFVKGLQGDHPQYLKVAACAKHYAVHSGPESLRHSFNAAVSLQDLWDTYLPAFEALVGAEVESVMGAYNRTNGEVCCGSHTLLQEILREKWGFKGHVVSDCWAIRDFYEKGAHEVVETREAAAALAVRNGCDLNCGCTFDALLMAVDKGLIAEETIDNSLRRLLRTRFRLGMFDNEDRLPWSDLGPEVVNCPAHQELSQEAAERSMVLLKNKDGFLPLNPNIKRMYLVGPNAADNEVLFGNYYGTPVSTTSFLEGLAQRAPETMTIEFRPGLPLSRAAETTLDWGLFEAVSKELVIAVLGLHPRIEGEEGDTIESTLPGDREDVLIPQHQIDYLEKLVDKNRNLVVVLTGGSPMALPEALLEKIPALIYAWYPGERGGRALANILFGDVNPSGRLPVTVPRRIEDIPPFEDYSMEGRTYRYSNAEPLFPFGFGLSYSQFRYDKIELSASEIDAGQNLEVSIVVSNISEMAGREIVQLYLHDLEASTRVPNWKLVGFTPVDLAPGATEAVSFTVAAIQMALINENGDSVIEPGAFELAAGGAVPDLRATTLGSPDPVKRRFTIR